jgi:hypothetical protein
MATAPCRWQACTRASVPVASDFELLLECRQRLLDTHRIDPGVVPGVDMASTWSSWRPAGKLRSSARKSASHSRSKNGVASLAYSRSKNGVASLAYGARAGTPVQQGADQTGICVLLWKR